jgi:hypothetical protein
MVMTREGPREPRENTRRSIQGDGLMAFWFIDGYLNRSIPRKAISCAQKIATLINNELETLRLTEMLDIRIGMHCGKVAHTTGRMRSSKARVQIVGRVSGRRNWTVEQKLAIIGEGFASGSSVASTIERHCRVKADLAERGGFCRPIIRLVISALFSR